MHPNRLLVSALVAAFLAIGVPQAVHGQGIATGKGQIVVNFQGEAIDVFTYKPRNFDGGPVLYVQHGVGRNAEDYRDWAIPLADRHGAIVVAPLLDRDRFRGERFQRGGVLRGSRVQPKESWTYALVPAAVAEVRRLEGRPELQYYVTGHSAGGQFSLRLAAMMPGEAVRIVPANPGSVLMPTRDMRWGYGFGGLPRELANDDALRAYLAAPITLLLGTADTATEGRNLDRSEPALAQGPHRFARGHTVYAAAKKLAQERGWEFNWRLIEVPGVGHSGRRMLGSEQASEALFGEGR